MNLNDEYIDKLFRDAASNEQSPAFKDAYWSEMEALIKKDKALRTSKIMDSVWMLFSALSFAGMLIFALTYSFTDTVELADNTSKNESNAETIQLITKESFDELDDGFDAQMEKTQHASAAGNIEAVEQTSTVESRKVSMDNTKAPSAIENPSGISSKYDETVVQGEENEAKKSKATSSGGARDAAMLHELKDNVANEEKDMNSLPEAASQQEQLSTAAIRLSPMLVTLSGLKMEEQSLIATPIRRIQPDHGFSLDFGLSFAEPYKGSAASSNRFSLAGMYNLDFNNIIFRTGMGVTVERAANLSVRQESMVYGYNVTKYEHTLAYKSFTELYLPLEIGYRYNNTTFGAGGQLNMLVGTRMVHTEMINGQIISDRMLNNRTEGLNTFTGGAYLWVQQHLNARLMAGMRVGKNIVSRIDAAEYVHDISRPNPIFGQIYVSYRLW